MSTLLQNKTASRVIVALIALAMIFTSLGLSTAQVDAASKKAPTKITLQTTAKTVDVKGKVTVSVKSVKPAKASKAVTYKSSNKKIATVNSKGVVTGKKKGTVKITVTSKKNKKVKKTITIKVKNLTPKSVSLDKKKIKLTVGDTAKLKATLAPVGLYNKGVTWKSNDEDVATVKNGVITAKAEGSASITVRTKEKGRVATCTVIVEKPAVEVPVIEATGIELDKSEVSMDLTGKAILTASVEPEDTTQEVTFTSSDTTVAIVNSDGYVTPKSPGTATITAEINGKTAECAVTVEESDILSDWVLTGYYKEDSINTIDIADDATVRVWNNSKQRFASGKNTEATILGNYVQLIDTNDDDTADVIQVVKYKHGKSFWNADTPWINGVASEESNPDQPIDDATGWAMYDVEYRIPMGERQLANWGITDWSGTTDWAVYEDSPYWENTDYDYYNLTSSDTLTMLTGYKTSLQETGSTCVMNSALSVLEWYGERGDLNAKDLSSLRSESRNTRGGTSIWELETVFEKLGELGITGKWNMKGWTDNEEILSSGDPTWLKEQLAAGHPVMVIWNSYGAHGQVIIGYDDMGTPETNDDVLIMMDPYDTTDHNPDGYIIQSYERLIWGRLTWNGETTYTKCLAVWPEEGWNYTATKGDGMPLDKVNIGNVDGNAAADWDNEKLITSENFVEIDGMKIPYDTTAMDLQAYYEKAEQTYVYAYLDTGLSGAAGVERSGDVAYSPYYQLDDFYGTEAEIQKAVGSSTLDIIDNFSTIQQATEFSCGVTSAYMVMYNYGLIPTDENGKLKESDVSLSKIRQVDEATGLGEAGATYVEGLDEVFAYMEETYGQKWATASDQDYTYDEWDYAILGDKYLDGELIQYLVANDVPMIIGWDEWGGHWQVVIGYDNMGTEATQDDVVILADSYDTTDHNQNGYVIESYERLIYGWNSEFETWNDEAAGVEDDMYYAMYIAVPDTDEYADVISTLGLK